MRKLRMAVWVMVAKGEAFDEVEFGGRKEPAAA